MEGRREREKKGSKKGKHKEKKKKGGDNKKGRIDSSVISGYSAKEM